MHAFVKTSLARLHDRQQSLVTQAWQNQGGRVDVDDVPDLFKPFDRLVTTLLPHLEWVGVSDEDPHNIQCRFRPAGAAGPVFDIDELSSGEKAALALLLPFVERQAEQLITPTHVAPGVVPLTMLLDEPEIHLHPLLQLQVLHYLRSLAAMGNAQFILATQSPTLLDELTDEGFSPSPARAKSRPAVRSPDWPVRSAQTDRRRSTRPHRLGRVANHEKPCDLHRAPGYLKRSWPLSRSNIRL